MKRKLLLVILLASGTLCGGIVNGGFETGDLTGWSALGTVANVQVLTGLGSIAPPEGSFFAFLSNGPGQVNDPAITLDATILTSIPYTVSPGASVSFVYDFLSAEPNDGTGNPDFFQIRAVGLGSVLLASGMITSGQAAIAGGPVVAPDGTTLIYHNGLATVTNASLASLVGQTITLQFLVSDAIDNSFDSALLVDNITGVGLAPVTEGVPEPNSLALLAVGCLVLVVKWCLKRDHVKEIG